MESNVIIESRDVQFIKDKFINDECSKTIITYENISSSNKRKSNDDPIVMARVNKRIRKEKSFGLDFISSQALVFLVEGNREKTIEKGIVFIAN